MSEVVKCRTCGKDVTGDAEYEANQNQFAGYNMMSIQYAEPWSPGQLKAFYDTYVCKACREAK